MRRFILLFAACIFASITWSQSVTIQFKNSNTVEYDMNDIKSITFLEGDNSEQGQGEGQSDNVLVEGAVDLGLSVLWASCNIGADSPEQVGIYCFWGEVKKAPQVYTKDDYIYYNKSKDTYMDIGFDISGTQYDIAHVKLGGKWRLPTVAEFTELINNCQWEWVKTPNYKGYKVTGKNGNSIFMQSSGDLGSGSEYWSSELKVNSIFGGKSTDAYVLYLGKGNIFVRGSERANTLKVRPVMSK